MEFRNTSVIEIEIGENKAESKTEIRTQAHLQQLQAI